MNRRRHDRFRLPLHLRYRLVDGESGTGQVCDISRSGVFFWSDAVLPVDSPIFLRIEWPAPANGGMELNVSGHVMRSDCAGTAVAFTECQLSRPPRRKPLLQDDGNRRQHIRFPIVLPLQYALRNRTGAGQTCDMSCKGISFAAGRALPLERSIRLWVRWPCLLDGRCPLQLHLIGRILRSDPKTTAVSIRTYEFRTMGRAARVDRPAAVSL